MVEPILSPVGLEIGFIAFDKWGGKLSKNNRDLFFELIIY